MAVYTAWGGACIAWYPTRHRPYVRWIFEQRLAGPSVASIARALNVTGVPCPSGADPARTRHRSVVAQRSGG